MLFLIINVGGGNDNGSYNHLLGIGYALLGAVVYAIVILINKHIKKLGGFETTLIQLVVATIVLLPVVLLQSNLSMLNMGIKSWTNMLLLGIVHTGIAYLLYFKSMKEINAQSVAILSYIDPISAVIMATLFLGEDITIVKVIGGILILGSTYFAESVDVKISFKENKENSERSEGS